MMGVTGMDCQRIWPERWVRGLRTLHHGRKMVLRKNGKPVEETNAADLLWPLNPGVMATLFTNGIPVNLGEFVETPYAARASKVYPALLGEASPRVKNILTASFLRSAWNVLSWQDQGARLYILDLATAEALCWTKVEDLEIDTLQLPVRSFYVQIPRDMEWKVSLDKENSFDPEPEQLMEGYMVSGEYVDGKLVVLHVVMCGKAQKSEDDNIHWVKLSLEGCKTIGEFIHRNLTAEPALIFDGFTQEIGEVKEGQHLFFAKPEAMRLLMGAILYITSAHPHLRAIPTPLRPKGNKTTPRHVRKWKQYEQSTRAAITWVGGPLEGVVHEDGVGLNNEDMGLEGAAATRRPPRPHMRAGHYRRVWLGPVDARTGRELRWIKPVAVGDWDRRLAWEALKGHRVGKVRTAEVVR